MGITRMKDVRGQSTLEYILVFGAVIVIIIGIITTSLKVGVEKQMTESGNTITNAAGKVKAGLGL